MQFLKFDSELCTLCGVCTDKCPFGAISMGEKGITVNENCRMCGICVREWSRSGASFILWFWS